MTTPLASLFLRLDRLVFLEARASAKEQDLSSLDSDLLALGYVLSKDLQATIRALPDEDFLRTCIWLEATLRGELGAAQAHVPLFRRFPKEIPKDTRALYVKRLLVCLFQEPEQPCLLCTQQKSVQALDPCGHLVCSSCWDGANYSACPVCYRQISSDNTFLKPQEPPKEVATLPKVSLRLLHLGVNLEESAARCLHRLASRSAALSPADEEALSLLLQQYKGQVAEWLPERIEVREIVALIVGQLAREGSLDAAQTIAAKQVKTATDVLRVYASWMKADVSLVKHPKPLRSPPRALRRLLLSLLERLDGAALVEDLSRHAALWKKLGEKLHPFEDFQRYPKTALAFAVIRRTKLDTDGALQRLLAELSEHMKSLREHKGSLRFRGWAGRVEEALRKNQLEEALALLGQRPGELIRRFDLLLRRATPAQEEAVLTVAAGVIHKASAPSLLATIPHLRRRHSLFPRRVFFPKGSVTQAKGIDDKRPLLTQKTIEGATALLQTELLSRASQLEKFSQALLDERLAGLLAPFREKTASKALVTIPRGSALPLPQTNTLRFFIHWVEVDDRVDLDLSAAFFDEEWGLRYQCSFTNLSECGDAIRHSGDLTSAPAPQGASEFIDINLPELQAFTEEQKTPVRYVGIVVFSYNSIPFESMERAFAGFLQTPSDEELFDPRLVEQRFDLRAEAKIAVPMFIDLKTREMLWVDMNIPEGSEGYHDIDAHQKQIKKLGKNLFGYFGEQGRLSLWELSCLHAAGRAAEVQLRTSSGVLIFRRRADESTEQFFSRLMRKNEPDETRTEVILRPEPALMCLAKDDLPIPDGSIVYVLRAEQLNAERVHRVSTSDLVAQLQACP